MLAVPSLMKCGLSAAAGPAASTITDSAAPRGPRSKNRSRRICSLPLLFTLTGGDFAAGTEFSIASPPFTGGRRKRGQVGRHGPGAEGEEAFALAGDTADSARVGHRPRRPAPCKVMKCGLATNTGVPVITTAPTRGEHDFDALHCPVSFDRLLEQDREVQVTTPCLGVSAPIVRRPRPTMTGLPRGEEAQHIAGRAQIPLARIRRRVTALSTALSQCG